MSLKSILIQVHYTWQKLDRYDNDISTGKKLLLPATSHQELIASRKFYGFKLALKAGLILREFGLKN